jgi:hypothetical protein
MHRNKNFEEKSIRGQAKCHPSTLSIMSWRCLAQREIKTLPKPHAEQSKDTSSSKLMYSEQIHLTESIMLLFLEKVQDVK